MSGGEYMEDAPEALPTIEKIQGTLKTKYNLRWGLQVKKSRYKYKPRVPIVIQARRHCGRGIGISKSSKPEKRQD